MSYQDDAVFMAAMQTRVIPDEGGYTDDPNDPGNWTPSGELKGTKYGISAKSYPDLDIKNLTLDQADSIYYTDWWLKNRYSLLPDALAIKVFDIAINVGEHEAVQALQEACVDLGQTITVDCAIGPATAAAVAACDPQAIHDAYAKRLESYYEAIVARKPTQGKYLAGWLKRADE